MRAHRFFFAAALLACAACQAQSGAPPQVARTVQEAQLFRDLIADPAFIRSVARANGLSEARFLSQEVDLQREMVERYIAQAGGLQAFARDGSKRPADGELLADLGLLERVARSNGMSLVRFMSQERNVQLSMARAFLARDGAGCPVAAGPGSSPCSR